VLLLIDNHDSFTHNLAHLVAQAWEEPDVVRVDRLTPAALLASKPEALIVSPGPGRPQRSPNLMRLLRAARGRMPVLGVCLGHQAMGQLLGLKLLRAPRPVHGHAVELDHAGSGLFHGCRPGMRVARYHSLVLEGPSAGTLPLELAPGLWLDARCAPGLPMALRAERVGWWGLQFHPESFLSEDGLRLLRNFRAAAQAWTAFGLQADGESASLSPQHIPHSGVAWNTSSTDGMRQV
jgi:anthranilate synthase/aminodeoxychorismate synthase-like glutamine amidotransferase